jgi:two-component system OmpR family response regulator
MTALSSNCHREFIRTREDRVVRVLIVADELRMASLIRRGLVNEGLAADMAGSGEDALWMAPARDYDAVVLDVMLPDLDGFEVCRRLRTAGVWAPVLMLSGARLGRRWRGRPRQRCGRLPRQAVRVRRSCWRGYARSPAVVRPGGRRCSPSVICGWIRRRER